MKVQVDTDKVGSWVKGHAQWLVPVGLVAISWFAARTAAANNDDMRPWWAILSVASGLGSLPLIVMKIGKLYDDVS